MLEFRKMGTDSERGWQLGRGTLEGGGTEQKGKGLMDKDSSVVITGG